MNVKFYLNTPDASKSAIFLYLTFDSLRLRLSSGMSIDPITWDEKNQKVKKTYTNSLIINTKLTEIKAKAEEVFAQGKFLKTVDLKTFIHESLKEYLSGKKPKRTTRTLEEHINDFISLRKKDPRFSSSTVSIYSATLVKLKEFSKAKRINLSFDSIDNVFYTEFCDYLIKIGLRNNSVGKYVKILKVMLKTFYDMGITKNDNFRKFKVWKNEAVTVALNEEEILKLEMLDVSESINMQQAKSLFLSLCYSGLRYNDLVTLKQENINYKDKTISLVTEKTRTHIVIPLHKKLEYWLNELFKLPPITASNTMINKRIKTLAKKADITDLIETINYKGKKTEKESYPKWELCSSHTGRRSYITNLLRRGALPEFIMMTTSHKDRSSFQRYVRLSQNEAAKSLKNIWDEE